MSLRGSLRLFDTIRASVLFDVEADYIFLELLD